MLRANRTQHGLLSSYAHPDRPGTVASISRYSDDLNVPVTLAAPALHPVASAELDACMHDPTRTLKLYHSPLRSVCLFRRSLHGEPLHRDTHRPPGSAIGVHGVLMRLLFSARLAHDGRSSRLRAL